MSHLKQLRNDYNDSVRSISRDPRIDLSDQGYRLVEESPIKTSVENILGSADRFGFSLDEFFRRVKLPNGMWSTPRREDMSLDEDIVIGRKDESHD
jgi:hypothetical protein